MRLFAVCGIAMSLGLYASVSFADYTPRMNDGYQAGSRYRTAFRKKLQEAQSVVESMPSPTGVVAQPDHQVIGSSTVAHAPPISTTSSAGCNSCSSGSVSYAPSTSYAPTTSYAPSYASSSCGSCSGGCADGGGYGYGGCSSCGGGLLDKIHGLFGGGCGGGCGLGGGGIFGGGGCGHGGALGGGCGGGGLFANHFGSGWNGGMGGPLGGFRGGCASWYGGLYGLAMRRTDDFGQTLSVTTANLTRGILSSNQGYDGYFGGFETRFGRYFCQNWAVEGAYWGLFPGVQTINIRNAAVAGDLRTALGFNQLQYNNGAIVAPVAQFFGDATREAAAHRLRRRYEINNAEVNLVNAPMGAYGNLSYAFLGGFRFFKFNDGFTYSSDYVNGIFGDDPANELHYDVDVDNTLAGFQLGSRMNYQVAGPLAITGGATFGIYNNHITHRQFIRGGRGYAYDANNNDYNIRSSKDNVAFLGDFSLGLAYNVSCNWRLTGGYRVLAASGIANATSQIPRNRDFYIYDRARAIDSHDSLILHGAFFGVEHTW